MNSNEFHHQKALSFEKEAISLTALETDREIQINVENILSDCYREIYICKDIYPKDYKRILDEYNNRKLRMSKWLSEWGVKFNYTESEECIITTRLLLNNYVIQNFYDIIGLFFKFPFLSTNSLNEILNERMSICPLDNMANVVHTNNEGNTIGTSSGKDNVRAQILMSYRINMLYYINESLSYLYVTGYTSKLTFEELDTNLSKWMAEYIEPDLKRLWIQGLSAGFKRNFIESSYILTPLIERALHDLAETKLKTDITKLHKIKQDEPTLGGDLKLLKPFLAESLWYELSLFLNEGIGINFRNKLCHGLINLNDISVWGAYLWWIGLSVFVGAINNNTTNE